MEGIVGKSYAGGVVARVEGHHRRIAQILINKELDTMAIGEQLTWVDVLAHRKCLCIIGSSLYEIDVMDKSQRRDTARLEPEATLHSFRGCEGKLPFFYYLLELHEVEGLMAFHGYEIVALATVIAQEQVLAVGASLQVFERVPEGESFFYGEEGWMVHYLVVDGMRIEKFKYWGDTVLFHV